MIQLIFFISPMSFLSAFSLLLRMLSLYIAAFLIGFFLDLLAGQSNMTFFSKQGLKVIIRDHFFIVS
jgi:hypothetical protein